MEKIIFTSVFILFLIGTCVFGWMLLGIYGVLE
jgi:hypothetical protein